MFLTFIENYEHFMEHFHNLISILLDTGIKLRTITIFYTQHGLEWRRFKALLTFE